MSASILAVGDSYLPTTLMRPRLGVIAVEHPARFIEVDPAARPPLEWISEYQGQPSQIIAELEHEEILLVHAAPVTAELLDSCPGVRLVACARGNPLNIDLAAAAARGVTVLNTPAKNADSVADLTMTFTQLLFRGVPAAARWLEDEACRGERHLDSTFAGGRWMAREPRNATMGIVGFGAIGRRVAAQAEFYGMRVIAYDPYLAHDPRLVPLDRLLEESDIITLHAKVTDENHHLLSTDVLARTKPGVFIVNTARQALVDEHALLSALEDGHVAGAALDVCEPDGPWPALAQHPRVVVTPHLGGATAQTQGRAMDMLIADIRRYAAGEPMQHVAAGPRQRERDGQQPR